MHHQYDLVITSGSIVENGKIFQADIGIIDGCIETVGDLSKAASKAYYNAQGLHVLPGIIDSHVHFRDPGGSEDQENFITGSAGAALGGITTVMDMPNTNPTTTNAIALENKVAMATGKSWCDFGFYVGATRENRTSLLEIEKLPGCCGIKLFMGSSTGSLLVDDDESISAIIETGNRVIAVHAEDEYRLNNRAEQFIKHGDVTSHTRWRDDEAARLAIERLRVLAKNSDRKIHILHVSTAAELSELLKTTDSFSFECTPHHLILNSDDAYAKHDTFAQVNPPLRHKSEHVALWQAIQDEMVSTIGSDHAPHPLSNKLQKYPHSPSGLPSTEIMLSLMLDCVHKNLLTLPNLVRMMCHNPAKIFAIAEKGHIKSGFDADITIVDLNLQHQVEAKKMASLCGWSPYEKMNLCGKPVATILRGNFSMRDGELLSSHGKAANFGG